MMSHTLSHNMQSKEIDLEGSQFTQEFLPSHRFDDEQEVGTHKELAAFAESSPKASPMTLVYCPYDNTPSPCLLGERGKSKGRNDRGCISPFSNVSATKSKESRVALIRVEFVELTNDPLIAAVLNQLVYWSQRVSDFDLFWREETSSPTDISSPQYGWFYKSTTELLEETMVRVTPVTMRRYLSFLTEQGWVQTRVNPRYKWNRTPQYRVNLRKLYPDLQALGFGLPGFPQDAILSSLQKEDGEKNVPSIDQNLSIDENKILPLKEIKFSSRTEKNDFSNDQNLSFDKNKSLPSKERLFCPQMEKNVSSNDQNLLFEENKILPSKVTKLYSREEKNVPSNTEIITENINKEHTQDVRAREDKNFSEKDFSAKVLEIWDACISHEGLPSSQLTDERRRKIHALLPLYFENDLGQWRQFCERVARSPFLMGQGARKWRVSLDWVLVEENLLKVLEGNFDDGKLLEQKIEKAFEDVRTKEIHTILESIIDPVWKGWCSQLNFSPDSHNYISLLDLKAIANAKFLEVEDDRLVWVGSSDARSLSKIEDLSLKILSIVQGTFPHARAVRTRLSGRASSLQAEMPDPSQIPAKPPQNKGNVHYA